MRLSSFEQNIIKKLSIEYLGENSKIYVFGSRVDDDKRGGDIDLFVSCESRTALNLENKIQYLAAVKQAIGEQKIDLVFDTETTRRKTSFYNSISEQKIELY